MNVSQFSFFIAGLMAAAASLSAQTNTFPTSGNVGIGTTTPGAKLHLMQVLNNPTHEVSAIVEQPYAITATDTDYIKGLDIYKSNYSIPSSVTANGYQIGLASQVFVSDTNFQGTISAQFGIWSRTGIYVAAASGPRTIHNAYGIYLEGLTSAGTISNHYGVYQTGAGTKNYFQGNVGIGTTAPETTVDVQGSYASFRVYGTATSDTAQIQLRNQSQIWQWTVDGSDSNKLNLRDGGGNAAWTVDASRNLGIGTASPDSKLQIDVATNKEIRAMVGASSALADLATSGPGFSFSRAHDGADNISGIFTYSDGSGNNRLALATRDDLVFAVGGGATYTASPERLRITSSGNVGIGTTNPAHKLAVNGTIRAKEVVVDTGWSDYVFKPDYQLAPLSEVEAHIKAHGHLPGVPSEAQVAKEGVSVGEMQSKLLAKIEELTLHQIEQDKRLQKLESENAALRANRP